MESNIRTVLRELTLPNTTLDALSLLDHITIDDKKVFLVFRMPDDFAFPDASWEQVIKKSCETVCDIPVLITFNRHNKIPQKAVSGIHGVQHVIAVASGKGGVGKSSICLNLALAIKKQGFNVGVLDADIYGPSLPTMVDLFEKPETTSSKQLVPHQKFGLKLMSMGFMVPKDAAVIWRGLMVQSAIGQMLTDVVWDDSGVPLDVLLIDMPPGTGDAQLTVAQKANLSGAVIVTTSQELALIDARRAVKMFEKVHTPILGVVENMSDFLCPSCDTVTHIFPKQDISTKFPDQNIRVLGTIPLDIAFRESGDIGEPFLEKYQDHPISKMFYQIAKNVVSQLYA